MASQRTLIRTDACFTAGGFPLLMFSTGVRASTRRKGGIISTVLAAAYEQRFMEVDAFYNGQAWAKSVAGSRLIINRGDVIRTFKGCRLRPNNSAKRQRGGCISYTRCAGSPLGISKSTSAHGPTLSNRGNGLATQWDGKHLGASCSMCSGLVRRKADHVRHVLAAAR